MKKLLLSLLILSTALPATAAKPNIIIIFTDDQGYQDLGCFGSPNIRTPNIDRMAKEGRKFTNFMVASPICCTPSRAALMTGSYPKRVGIARGCAFPADRNMGSTPPNTPSPTISNPSATPPPPSGNGIWGITRRPFRSPTDSTTTYGIPYSNDMNHPENKRKGEAGHRRELVEPG